MLKVNDEEKRFLVQNIENAEQSISTGDLNGVLLPLAEWIAVNGYDEKYQLMDIGREAERIYDSIYAKNI